MKHSGVSNLRFLNAITRFFYGRYGTYGVDSLNRLLAVLAIVLSVLNLLLQSPALYIIQSFFMFWFLFRMLSKNISARQAENQKLGGIISRINTFFSILKRRFKERSTHIYKTCPNCKAKLRFSRIRGVHTARCPCCKTSFTVNVK